MTTFSSVALIFPPEFLSVVLLLFLALSSASSSVLHHQRTLTAVNWRQKYFKTFISNSLCNGTHICVFAKYSLNQMLLSNVSKPQVERRPEDVT